ncbi:hypothetical protein RFI_00464, partial [Reticulomyxa filosa]
KLKQVNRVRHTFLTLKELPTQLSHSQCVIHKHELLICGSNNQRACYSYHTLKGEYKLICEYPSDIKLHGHNVVKLVDNNSNDKHNNLMTLLFFIWSNDNNNDENENKTNKSKELNELNQLNKSNNYNQWLPFTDNRNHLIIIGRDQNHNFFRAKLSNAVVCSKTLLSIEYDENNNTLQFHKLPVCDDITSFSSYAYVCINDLILFFGGWNSMYGAERFISKSVHKYSIRENK